MTIFDKKKDVRTFDGVKDVVCKSVASGEWVSTTDLYRACSMRVKRELLHSVIKDLLEKRDVVMRVVKRDGRVTNEFKRVA